MTTPNDEPVFRHISVENDLTPEQQAEGMYRDSLSLIKGHLDAHDIDPSTVLSEQELADAIQFEEQEAAAAAAMANVADEGVADWFEATSYYERQQMFPDYLMYVALPLIGSDQPEELRPPYDGAPQTITIVGNTFKMPRTGEVWESPQSADSAE